MKHTILLGERCAEFELFSWEAVEEMRCHTALPAPSRLQTESHAMLSVGSSAGISMYEMLPEYHCVHTFQ
jgi:hypothetical protein